MERVSAVRKQSIAPNKIVKYLWITNNFSGAGYSQDISSSAMNVTAS